ncbi:TlpA family protein disulfide reductase [Ekhidna sp.]|uniref:TlpA family protein disulfide reductase n=1 Tax=Ekhidna sp. TaxID=2608089 RepID=UPI003CCBED1B
MRINTIISCVFTLLSFMSFAQEKVQLNEGLPEPFQSVKSYLKPDDASYKFLNTGNDSLQVAFGTILYNGKNGYWSGILIHDKPIMWSLVSLSPISNQVYGDTLDLEFNDKSHVIKVYVTHNAVSNTVSYQWLGNTDISDVAFVQSQSNSIIIGEKMPFFKVSGLDGSIIELDDFQNSYLVINWWATQCRPCVVEMPGLNKLTEKYRDEPEVVFLAISPDDKHVLKSFLGKREFRYSQSIGSKETIELFGNSYPKHLIINPDGKVVYFSSGGSESTSDLLDSALEELLIE